MPSDYETRKRSLAFDESLFFAVEVFNSAGDLLQQKPPTRYNDDRAALKQITTSRRNGWRHGTRYSDDVGGNFESLSYRCVQMHSPFDLMAKNVRYYGHLVAKLGEKLALPISTVEMRSVTDRSTTSMLDAWGTQFIAAASPTSPQAGLTTALIELKREGLPKLNMPSLEDIRRGKVRDPRKDLGRSDKDFGSQYLNFQFGWLPIISDLRSLAHSVLEAESILSQFYRDNGKLVRRRRGGDRLDLEEKNTYEVTSPGYPTLSTYAYSPYGNGRIIREVTLRQNRWFSGAFIYHLPSEVSALSRLHRLAVDARYLLGLSLTPADIWNVLPFSWLVDWVVNTGDILSSFSDQFYNRQVLKYGYVMSKTTLEHKDRLTLKLNDGIHTPTTWQWWTLKQRRQATPYGFGLTYDALTGSQLGVLSALGISSRR